MSLKGREMYTSRVLLLSHSLTFSKLSNSSFMNSVGVNLCGAWNVAAVRASFGKIKQFVNASFEFFGDMMFEPLGFVVNRMRIVFQNFR